MQKVKSPLQSEFGEVARCKGSTMNLWASFHRCRVARRSARCGKVHPFSQRAVKPWASRSLAKTSNPAGRISASSSMAAAATTSFLSGENQFSHSMRARRPISLASATRLRNRSGISSSLDSAIRMEKRGHTGPAGDTHSSDKITGTRPSCITSKIRWEVAAMPRGQRTKFEARISSK